MTFQTKNIFGSTAPAYYAAGLQAIPLYEREKRPVVTGWSKYAEVAIDPVQQRTWIDSIPNSNIGLALGKVSGVIIIDIDTEDEKIYNAIMAVLPYSPWHRKGRKGLALAYKWNPIKTFRVKNSAGEMLVECLSSGTQCVMPPSIHPDTQLPYTANADLAAVKSKLICLPEDIEKIIRDAVVSAGATLSHSGWSKVTEYVSAGARDTSLTDLAGLFAYAVTRGDRTLQDAIGMLRSSCDEFVENVAGDPVDVDKHVNNMLKFLHRDVLEKGKVLPKGWDAGYTPEQLREIGVELGIQQTEWDFDESRTYLHDVFESAERGSTERAEAVEIVLAKVAKSTAFTRIDEDRILQYIKEVSGLGVQIPTLRARLRELRSGSVKGNDHSEIARAMLKDIDQQFVMRWYKEEFWKWVGSHWEKLPKKFIAAKISQSYGHLDACKKNSDINGIMNIISILCEEGIKKIHTPGVNFANGFLTEDLQLLPHNPDYGMVYTMPFRYRPEAVGDFPMFQNFLETSWGRDKDFKSKMDALQEAMGATIFGLGPRYQRAILLHGAPHSGKSQLLRIVDSLVTSNARCAVPPEDWSDKFLPSQMFGKILNVCGELSERHLINGQKFKDIVDGAEMSGQDKNKPIFTFRPMVTHWFASNHFPKSTDTSSGFTRRWLILTFHYPVSAKEKKADLGDLIVANEREAIVSWAALGIIRLLKNNDFTLPQSHVETIYEVSNINNSVKYFLTESNKVHLRVIDGFVQEDKLYNLYWAFCNTAGGMKPVGVSKFRAMMRELGSELQFKLKISQTNFGGNICLIEGLSIA